MPRRQPRMVPLLVVQAAARYRRSSILVLGDEISSSRGLPSFLSCRPICRTMRARAGYLCFPLESGRQLGIARMPPYSRLRIVLGIGH